MRRFDTRTGDRLSLLVARDAAEARRGAPAASAGPPPFWRVERRPDRSVVLTQPPRGAHVAFLVVALVLGIGAWVLIGPAIPAAFARGDLVLGFILSCVLLVINGCVAGMFWIANSLREQWRLGRNFLEVCRPTFDETKRDRFVGAKFVIVSRPVAEGGGCSLRVMTLVTVAELFWSTSPRLPLALGEFLSTTIGWPLNLPDELQRRFAYRAARSVERAMREGPPPGLGFTAEEERDGTLRMIRHSRAAGWGKVLLGLGGLSGFAALLCAVCELLGAPGPGVPGLIIFLVMGAGLALAGLRPAFDREEWRVGPDFLELRAVRFGSADCTCYNAGTVTLVRLMGSQDAWHLVVLTRTAEAFLLSDITPDAPLAMGTFLAECTGWPLKLPDELTKHAPPASPA